MNQDNGVHEVETHAPGGEQMSKVDGSVGRMIDRKVFASWSHFHGM